MPASAPVTFVPLSDTLVLGSTRARERVTFVSLHDTLVTRADGTSRQ